MSIRLTIATAILLTSASPALARTQIAPYLEVGQVLFADLRGNSNNDVLTYSTVAAGVDATVSNNRSELQVSYRYERRFAWQDDVGDVDIHSGLARGAFKVIPQALTIEAGALATRTRADFRGAAPILLNGPVDNITQVYSAYAGPTLATNIGELNVGAAYRVGYTKVEAPDIVAAPGGQRLDNFNDSVSQLGTLSVGMASGGSLPFGWTVSGAAERTDAGQLDQRFERYGVRGDIVVPLTPTVAAVGGVGYEDLQASQRNALLDAGGAPVIDRNGRFVTDPASPRVLQYDQDGIYWDAGVLWRPSRRTTLEARVGRRFGGWSYTGSLAHQVSSATSLQVGVYDQVGTFGQILTNGLSRLPVNFQTLENPLQRDFTGCVFGNGSSGNGASGAGGCLNSALSSVNSAVFRSRGIVGQLATVRGPWNAGIGLGYDRRTFLTPAGNPGVVITGTSDESYFAQAQLGYQIDDRSNVTGAVFANYFDSGIAGAPSVLGTGATAAYQRRFGRRLSATGALGLATNKIDGLETDVTASALLGMRYQF